MSAAVTSPRTSTRPNISTVPITPSSDPSSPARTGAGVTSISWFLTRASGPSMVRWHTPSRDGFMANNIQTRHLQVPVTIQDHVQGGDTAPVTLVEYADYECPYSRLANHAINAVQRELGAQLRFVYRNFPLREIHPHAQRAA